MGRAGVQVREVRRNAREAPVLGSGVHVRRLARRPLLGVRLREPATRGLRRVRPPLPR